MEALTGDVVGGVRRCEPLISITYLGPIISRDDATPRWLGAHRPAVPLAEVPPTDRSSPVGAMSTSESGCAVDGGAVDGLRRAGVHTTAVARPVFASSSYSRVIDGGAVEGLRPASALISATPRTRCVVVLSRRTAPGRVPRSRQLDSVPPEGGRLHLRARLQGALTEIASKLVF
jgi:hypothetical protein